MLSGTASEAYDDRLVGIVLTGASRDGSMGLKKIRENGGLAIVRSPETGVSEEMSGAAIAENAVDRILPQAAIGSFLYTLFGSYDG
ncbi:chemotaxis protein CheB [Desulfonema ishimotonii]|uniref:protein-glutamate methylesterase n=1 Tax=Desulfonema ishimotonii TaxID=45657 RepID=A0A401FV48_9BACT|nr:chemotaxis protein CheB [Desulfonema ishimotonii]